MLALTRARTGAATCSRSGSHNRGQLVSAIDAVARGGSVIDPKIVEVLVDGRARAERSPLAELTPREREVLAELA